MTESFTSGPLQGRGGSREVHARKRCAAQGSRHPRGRVVRCVRIFLDSSGSVITVITVWTAWMIVLGRVRRDGGSTMPPGGRGAGGGGCAAGDPVDHRRPVSGAHANLARRVHTLDPVCPTLHPRCQDAPRSCRSTGFPPGVEVFVDNVAAEPRPAEGFG